MNYKAQIILSATFTLLWTACDTLPEGIASSPYEITFQAEGLVQPATRATTDTLNVGSTFGVLAYNCPDGSFHDDSSQPDLLYNAWVQKYQSESFYSFRYIPACHWPATGKVHFVAYYPHNDDLAPGTITVSPSTLYGLPNFQVVLGLQKGSVDFSTAVVGPIRRQTGVDDPAGTPTRTTNSVNFAFKRRMSYIQFRCQAVNMPDTLTRLYVNQIKLRNIYRRGTFNTATPDGSGGKGKWEDLSIDATTGATLNLSNTTTPVRTDKFGDLVDPNGKGYYIAMFPQTYDNVEMIVTYTLEYLKAEGGCEYRITGTKRIPLTVNWKMGVLNIYDIEFAFIEAYGDKVLLNFNVQPWKTETINTEM